MDLLKIKRLSNSAIMPIRSSKHAAGFDLSAAHAAKVPARGRALVMTDWAVAVPPGTYARVAPRSGLALRHGIDLGAGVVDYDYRGNVGVVMFNLSDEDFQVEPGMRIAQLILERIANADVVEVTNLDATDRGEGGFGSTGH